MEVADGCFFRLRQMVCGNDGNRHCGPALSYLAVPGCLVVLSVHHLLRLERVSVYALYGYFGVAVYPLPGDLARDDQAPDAVAVFGDVPDGLRDDC